MKHENKVILITEDVWRNSHLSVVRFYGKIVFDNEMYIITDKRGHDIFECSMEAERAGREKAIEPGEPVDLCRLDFLPIYRQLGRDRFLKFLRENKDINTVETAKKRLEKWNG